MKSFGFCLAHMCHLLGLPLRLSHWSTSVKVAPWDTVWLLGYEYLIMKSVLLTIQNMLMGFVLVSSVDSDVIPRNAEGSYQGPYNLACGPADLDQWEPMPWLDQPLSYLLWIQDAPQPQASGDWNNKDYCSQVLVGTQHAQIPHSKVTSGERGSVDLGLCLYWSLRVGA